jgi:hypothetical protein
MTTHARTRTSLPSVLLSVATAAALAAALVAVPATAASPTPRAASPAVGGRTANLRPRLVTLLTGDRVLVRHDAAGRTFASLTPHSRHYGRPVEFVNTETHTWVVPRLAPSVRARFDPSVFDVAALARSGRVRLNVTFDRGATVRALPGLDVRTATAREGNRGRTTVAASYDAHRPLPASLVSSLRGARRVSVAGAPAASPAATAPSAGSPAYQLRTLTINGTTATGRPIPGADVFVLNADDGRLFGAFGGIVKGQWKVSVPSGNYLVVTSDFRHVVVKQIAVGNTDAVLSLSMADATVKPRMTLPSRLSTLSPSLDILGSDEARTNFFDFGWAGIFPRVSPLSHVVAGSIHTEVADLWSRKGYRPYTFTHHHLHVHPIEQVVAAKEVRSGIPSRLTFHYRKGDFAKVAIQHFATGPKQTSVDSWFGVSRFDFGAFVETFPSVRPSVVHGRFLAGRAIRWDSSTSVTDDFRSFSQLDQVRRYHRGEHARMPFFRGPVTPVSDRGGEASRTGFGCLLCVHDGQLLGNLSMFSSAGADQFGITDHGRYDLFRGHRRIERGRTYFGLYVPHVTPGQRMRLVATTSPQARKYVLSSRVQDTWRFRVPHGNRVIPILRAAYVPPTDLHSVGTPRHVSYPITFDNLGPVDARVTKASLKWSVDGRHWHRAALTRKDKNTFRVAYRNPAGTRAHRYLSLKVTARDAAGRSLSETVAHAYVLPHGKAGPSHGPSTQHHNRFRPNQLCRTSARHTYSCFVKLSAATRAAGSGQPDPAGWGAPALRSAYGLAADQNPGTVAVVVAFDYPHAEADLNHYRAQYGLPSCTHASGCFTKINQRGETDNYPQQDYDWGVEASLDLQMISASCPTCHIVLVEAKYPTDSALFNAEQAAVDAGATVTNHSFGRIELTGAQADAQHFVHPGVTAVASTGDFGYGPASFPASSPDVVAVGGTVLSRSATNQRGWTEKAWQYGGSGCSAYFDKPVGQTDTACHGRTAADVSAVARGLAIYNTSLPRRYRGWLEVDGTSASSPLVAGMIGSVGTPGVRPQLLYTHAADFNDVVGGSNGFCRGSYLCTGVAGYDGPTGLGSPHGVNGFVP